MLLLKNVNAPEWADMFEISFKNTKKDGKREIVVGLLGTHFDGYEEVQELINDKDKKIRYLEHLIKRKNAALKEAKDSEELIENLNCMLDDKDDKIKELEKTVEELERKRYIECARVADFEGQLDKARERITELEWAREEREKEIKKCNILNHDLNARIEWLEGRLKYKQGLIKQTTAEILGEIAERMKDGND